jgi:hypothetical protein
MPLSITPMGLDLLSMVKPPQNAVAFSSVIVPQESQIASRKIWTEIIWDFSAKILAIL